MEEKYIELLVSRCLGVKKNIPLFISYDKICKKFVDKVVDYAQKIGVKDIFKDEKYSYEIHDILEKSSLKKIKKNEMFNSAKWDEYAKKDAAFLMLESEIPNLMDDIDSEKVALVSKLKQESKPLYK